MTTNVDCHELSAGELETIVGGAALMSGVPNSIMAAGVPRQPHLPPHFPIPRYWASLAISADLRFF